MIAHEQPVVITGASTGIGKATALHLDTLGFRVLAEILQLYSPLVEFFDNEVKGLPGIPPKEVGRAVAQAVMMKNPKARFLIGPGAKKMRNLARLPVGLRDRLMYQAIYRKRHS